LNLLLYAIKRILLLVPVLFGVIVIAFFLSRVVPSDPVKFAAGPNATDEMIERLRDDFGTNLPISKQFIRYVGGIFQGDFGRSFSTRRPVSEDLKRFFPATLELVIAALILGQIIGIPLGIVSARYQGRWPDHLSRIFALGAISLPGFWLAMLLQLVAFTLFAGLMPYTGRFDMNLILPETITGLLLVDTLLVGDLTGFVVALKHLFFPALALSALAIATSARMSRAAMVDAMERDFVLTARAIGLPHRIILYRDAFRFAMVPVLTMIGLEFSWLMAGSVLVETIFTWPGLGWYLVEASLQLDYNPIIGTMVLLGLATGIANIIVDVSYAVVDPRIRIGS